MLGRSLNRMEGVNTGKLNIFLHFCYEISEVRIKTKGLKGNFLTGSSSFMILFYWVFLSLSSILPKFVFFFSENCLWSVVLVKDFVFFWIEDSIRVASDYLRSVIIQLSKVAGVAIMRKSESFAVSSLSKWHLIPKFYT